MWLTFLPFKITKIGYEITGRKEHQGYQHAGWRQYHITPANDPLLTDRKLTLQKKTKRIETQHRKSTVGI